MKNIFLLFFFISCFAVSHAQLLQDIKLPTRSDSLRGGLSAERTYFDILKYNLTVEVNPEEKYISRKNEITFEVLKNAEKIQLDLFENMQIDSILFQGKKLKYNREFNAVFIDFPHVLKSGEIQKL